MQLHFSCLSPWLCLTFPFSAPEQPFPTPLLALALCPAASAPVKAVLSLLADSPSAPVNVTVKHLKANSAVVTWDVLEDEVVIGFAISQQVQCLRLPRFAHAHLHPRSPPFPNSLAAV